MRAGAVLPRVWRGKRAVVLNLIEYIQNATKGVVPMHMPGHKRRTGLAPYLEELEAHIDVTEIPGLDDLHCAEGILKQGMEKTAALWGSRRAFWLVNGSTCGILASLYACVPPRGKVICARNCHRSVYNGLGLLDAMPVYIMPEFDTETGISGPVSVQSVEILLDKNPDAALVVVTSPTYEGVISDIEGICAAAHRRGIPLLVDEAHGAHLGFGSGFPGGAVRAGADIVVHSFHKTLPSLTQTGALHINGDIVDEREIGSALAVFETSSPSYVLMASIAGCVDLIQERGGELFRFWRENLGEFYAGTERLCRLSVKGPAWLRDDSKIVISTACTDMTGTSVSRALREEFRIETEMSSVNYALALTGMGDSAESLSALASALLRLDKAASLAQVRAVPAPVLPGRAMGAAEARRKKSVAVPFGDAAGRVSTEAVWAYPPGIPLIVPGETVSKELIELIELYLSAGVALRGTAGLQPGMLCVTADQS